MSTPGRRRALRALGRRRAANTRRLAAGKKPILGGKQVSKGTFRKRTGASASQAAAKKRLRKK